MSKFYRLARRNEQPIMVDLASGHRVAVYEKIFVADSRDELIDDILRRMDELASRGLHQFCVVRGGPYPIANRWELLAGFGVADELPNNLDGWQPSTLLYLQSSEPKHNADT